MRRQKKKNKTKINKLKKISGKLLLCGNIDISLCNNLYIDKIDNELEAFKIIDRRQNGLN